MNLSTAQQVFLGVFLLCHVAPGEFAGLDESLLHIGDFMEFQVGLQAACDNVTGGENATEEIKTAFSQCISKVTTDDRSLFVIWANICNHPDEYLKCWDTMKMESLSKCGKSKSAMLPALYKTTVTSFCEKDKGAKKIVAMKKAAEEIGTKKCDKPNTGYWTEFCKNLLPNFTAADLCTRHSAINQCVEKDTCDNIELGKLIRKTYADLRPLLQCKN